LTVQPNQQFYLDPFIRNVMGISPAVLPDDSVAIRMSYQIALMFVNKALMAIPGPCQLYVTPPLTTLTVYALAVYNLAGDRLVNFAQDVPNAPPVKGSKPPAPYFVNLRKQFNLNGFVSGAITSASDETTSASYKVPDWAEKLTVSQLSNLQTPWGRQYLGIAQSYGPTIWGLSRGRW
jgi:hypothetical protein